MKKNILANFIGKFWSILSSFLFIPLYIKYLGFDSYSVISFTLLIAGVMAVLDAGLTATLSREFARNDNDDEQKIKIFKTLETIYLLVTGFSVLAIFLCSNIIAEKWIETSAYTSKEVALFLKIISFDIGFQLLFRFYLGGLLGLEKQVKANFYQIGWGVLRNALVVILIMVVPNLLYFFIWQSLATILFSLVVKLSLEKELTGKRSLNFSLKIEKSVYKRIWKFAGSMLLIALVGAVNTQMDKIAISKLLSLESLGYYTLAISLAQCIVVVVNPIALAVLPRFTALYSEGREGEAIQLFNKIGIVVSIVVFACMANLSLFSKEIIWAWTGQKDLVDQAAVFLPVLSLSMTMLALCVLPYQVAIANGYTKLNNYLGLISMVITFPGYWIATKYFGAIGAAYVFCFVQILTTFFYVYFINRKFIKNNIFTQVYLKQFILPLTIALSLVFFFSNISNLMEENRILIFISIGVSTLLTILISSLILMPSECKSAFLKIKKIINV